jgi:two-component system phosphate regulon response regulator OmpR
MMDTKTRILVIDDDLRLRDLLKRYLSEQGYAVQTVADATAMRRLMTRENFDLLVLDLMLPGEDGLTLCRQLRAENNAIPIIMLTARGEDVDRIIGLEMGADDYLAKPFNPRELLARIHAVLRRRPAARTPPAAPTQEQQLVRFGAFELNLANRQLQRGNEPITLTSGEFALLKALVLNPRVPLSRDKLTEMARGKEYQATDRSIDVQMSRLRKLIEADPGRPIYLQTVWGFGYVFIPDGGKP